MPEQGPERPDRNSYMHDLVNLGAFMVTAAGGAEIGAGLIGSVVIGFIGYAAIDKVQKHFDF